MLVYIVVGGAIFLSVWSNIWAPHYSQFSVKLKGTAFFFEHEKENLKIRF